MINNGVVNNKLIYNSDTEKKLKFGIITIIFLTFCLTVTTFALVYETVTVDNNLFHTGKIEINLNDGKPVISEDEFLFEPGMTVEKDFFVKNDSTWAVYYKLYFNNIQGSLANALMVTIKDGNRMLYEGTMEQLNRKNVAAADDVLAVGEKRNLQMYFHFPEDTGNEMQNSQMTFDFCADAVQTKNNKEKSFD